VILEISRRSHKQALFCLAPAFALWANLHIQFFYGFALLGILAMGNTARYVIAAGAAMLATLINPYGIRVHALAVEYAGHASLSRYVEELRPPDLSAPYMWFARQSRFDGRSRQLCSGSSQQEPWH
jgi:hypothetical protein